jgi:4-amino-4-deoxy-L-arabinose transferase-like glycosyltransferase
MATFLRRKAAVLILAALILVRIPTYILAVMDIDETDFLVAARMMAKGAIPYVDVVEKKPVLAYLFYWPTTVFGFHLWPMQIIALGWIFATCWMLGRIAERWTGRASVGVAASMLAVLAVAAGTASVNLEMMFNLPTVLALWFFVRREQGGGRWNDLAAGLCIGIASSFKHQAGVLLGALMLALVWQWWRMKRGPQLLRHLSLLFGFSLPWAAAVYAYWRMGHLAEFYEWNIARNLFYASGRDAWQLILHHFLESILFHIVLATPLLWWLAGRECRRGLKTDPIRVALLFTFFLSWIPVSLGGRFYNHYYLQFIPSLVLLAAPGAADWLESWNRFSLAKRRRICLGFLLPAAFYSFYHVILPGLTGWAPGQEPNMRALSAWLQTNMGPDERLLVWGHYTPIFYYAERLPGSRYYNTSVHMGDYDPNSLPDSFDAAQHRSQPDIENTLADLERLRPAIFVDTAPANIHSWRKVPLDKFPTLEAYIYQHYEELPVRPGYARVFRRQD